MEAVRRRGRLLLLALTVGLTMLGVSGPAARGQNAKPAADAAKAPALAPAAKTVSQRIGAEVCLQCHSQYSKEWYTLRHNRYRQSDSAPETVRGCEGCHGPGSAHLEDEKFGKIRNPRKLTGVAQVEMCFQCHGTDMKLSAWLRTPHSQAGVGCGECHEMHKESHEPSLLKAQATKLCLSCHPEQEATFKQASHHPVLEGRMTCVDCHDVHAEGGDAAAYKAGNDKCVRCHMEKRGPFVFEHQTSPDGGDANCLSCHRPHGSSNQRLMAYLGTGTCLQCHSDIPADPLHTPRVGNCWQSGCHNNFHGSNASADFIN